MWALSTIFPSQILKGENMHQSDKRYFNVYGCVASMGYL